MLEDARRCWKMLEGLWGNQEMLEDARRCLKM